jgi:hypothetical protein
MIYSISVAMFLETKVPFTTLGNPKRLSLTRPSPLNPNRCFLTFHVQNREHVKRPKLRINKLLDSPQVVFRCLKAEGDPL